MRIWKDYKCVAPMDMRPVHWLLAAGLATALLACSNAGTVGKAEVSSEKPGAEEILISYATEAGNVAYDGSPLGTSDNSPYAAALAEHLGTRGLRLADLLMRVRNTVIELTDGGQQPWQSGSLGEPFYFAPVADSAAAGKRVALVIGNAEYAAGPLGPLQNPVNDASAVARVLREVGFDVMQERDLTRSAFRAALEGFRVASREAVTAVFYYSGHGLELEGVNHLLPIDFDTGRDPGRAVRTESVELRYVIKAMQARRKLLFLDTDRSSPFSKK